jgi:putative hydrolase of the HAD superfamily
MPQSTAVVFDFGGVMITPVTHKMVTMAEHHSTTVATMLEVLLGPQDSADHPWHRAERGELAVVDIQAQLAPWADRAGIILVGDEIEALMAPTYTIVAPVIARIASLRVEGYRTALLTNTFAEFRPTLERDFDLGAFDVIVESYAVRARKPEPAIYAATEEALGVRGDDIVYLDDFPQNLRAAETFGWQTIHVTDPVQALIDLDALLAR